jgi:hypothetical protein
MTMRNVTIAAACLCTAPLFFLIAVYLVVYPQSDMMSDRGMGYAYLALLLGINFGIGGILLVCYLCRRYLTPKNLVYLQIADGLGLAAWAALGIHEASQGPVKFDYFGYQSHLQVEVRVPKAALGGEPIEKVVQAHLIRAEGTGFYKRKDVRHEGSFAIVPFETTLLSVEKWNVRVYIRDSPALFTLDLPRRPERSTEWSNWISSILGERGVTNKDVTLRYRFRLSRYGTENLD